LPGKRKLGKQRNHFSRIDAAPDDVMQSIGIASARRARLRAGDFCALMSPAALTLNVFPGARSKV